MPSIGKHALGQLCDLSHQIFEDSRYTFGPGGQPIVVGGEIWHLGTMDFERFSLLSTWRSEPFVWYSFSLDEGIVKNMSVAERQIGGLTVDPSGDYRLEDMAEAEWLIEVVKKVAKAMPYIAYVEPFSSWQQRLTSS